MKSLSVIYRGIEPIIVYQMARVNLVCVHVCVIMQLIDIYLPPYICLLHML